MAGLADTADVRVRKRPMGTGPLRLLDTQWGDRGHLMGRG